MVRCVALLKVRSELDNAKMVARVYSGCLLDSINFPHCGFVILYLPFKGKATDLGGVAILGTRFVL
jgi:hypothetical protein